MTDAIIATLPATVRPYVEAQLPAWLQPRWFSNRDEALALAPGAQIGWFDMYDRVAMAAAISAARDMCWLNSLIAGMDSLPLAELRARRVTVTNGVGINAITMRQVSKHSRTRQHRSGKIAHLVSRSALAAVVVADSSRRSRATSAHLQSL